MRDFVHVEDVCDVVQGLILQEWQSGIYELGVGKPVNIEILYKVMTGKEPEKISAIPHNVPEFLMASPDKFPKRFYPKHLILQPEGKELV